MNILFIADLESHDLKWIDHFGGTHKLHVLRRVGHKSAAGGLKSIISDHGSIHDVSIFRPLQVFRTARKIKTIIEKNDIDILHIFFAEPNVLWSLFRSYFKLPICLTTRGTDVLITIPKFFSEPSFRNLHVRLLYKAAFKRCTAITCTSTHQKESIQKLFKCQEPQIIRTGFKVPKDETYDLKSLPVELKDRKFVLMPRMMRPLYNHEFTLKAIAQLPASILHSYVFVFLDKNSIDQEYVKSIEKQMLSLTNVNSLFLPKQDQHRLYTLFAHSSLVIMNPLSDGSPVTGFEAMYFESPLILGKADYDADLFGDWVIRLKSWSIEELAEAISKALSEQNTSRLSKAKEIVLTLANREIEMEKLGHMYNQLTR